MLDLDKVIERVKNCKLLPERDVQEICSRAIDLLIEEPNVQHVDTPVVVCGDIHGQLQDLFTLFKTGGECPQTRYLFLGDFVDRGSRSLECFLLLISLKLRYPDRIMLVRGNHECTHISRTYGFYDECLNKYGNTNVWNFCCEVFQYLSLGAVIGGPKGGIFCVHGGLSPEIETIDQIRSLDRNQDVPSEGAMCDLLWSDPEPIPEWKVSPRGAGYLFGSNVVQRFLTKNDMSLVVRAHQLVNEGYREIFDGTLVTVWSAPNYCNRCGNVASILAIDDNLTRTYSIFKATVDPTKKLKYEEPIVDYFL